MSSAYDHDSTHGENPNCTIPPQNQEEDDPPFSLHLFPSPFLDDNQFFLNHMIFPYHQNHQQQLMLADDDQINHETDSRYTVINKHNISTINTTTEEISTLTTRTTAATHHVPQSSSSEVAQKGKPSTNNDTNNKKKAPSTQRKRGKKDRHSKICTAQGLRDRRMRLSLQIARKFFDLQDTLGFDKASKTIDWLFSKSKKAVKKLSCNANHLAQMNNNIVPNNSVYSQVESDEMIMRKALTTTSDSVSGERKTGGKYNHSNAKEMREKARARARERTREKMMMRCLENAKQINYLLNHHQTSTGAGYNQLGYGGNPNFEAGEKEELMSMSSCPSQDQNNVEACHYKDLNSHSSSLHHQLASVGILDNFLGTSTATSSAASCSIFDYPRNDDALLFSGKNPTSIFMENSCYHHFQTENQDN